MKDKSYNNHFLFTETDLHKGSRPEMFCEKGVLRKFAKFTGKPLCQSLRPATLLKKRLWNSCFPVTVFLTEYLRGFCLKSASCKPLSTFSFWRVHWWEGKEKKTRSLLRVHTYVYMCHTYVYMCKYVLWIPKDVLKFIILRYT